MKITYKSDIRINGERDDLLAVFAQERFSEKYFPEIKKGLPSYMVPCSRMVWDTDAGAVINVPNRTLGLNIREVELEHIRQKDHSIIGIEVVFEAQLGQNVLASAYHVQKMVKRRLKSIKHDAEAGVGVERARPLVECGAEY